MVAGTYTFKLTVTDNSNLTGSANVTVTVNGTTPPPPTDGNTPPVALAGSNQYITLPTSSVYLMGGGSYDVGGWITNYAWSQVSGPNTATLTTISTTNVEAKNLIGGTYTFKLTVTDNGGATNSATMQVIVNGGTTFTANTTSTTTDISTTNSLVLYPNPVTTTLNVQVSNDITGDLTINVINSSGTTVKTVKATKSSYQFTQQVSMQDVTAGTYVVEVRFSDGSRQTGQVVKQ
jgi:hypothetical protein